MPPGGSAVPSGAQAAGEADRALAAERVARRRGSSRWPGRAGDARERCRRPGRPGSGPSASRLGPAGSGHARSGRRCRCARGRASAAARAGPAQRAGEHDLLVGERRAVDGGQAAEDGDRAAVADRGALVADLARRPCPTRVERLIEVTSDVKALPARSATETRMPRLDIENERGTVATRRPPLSVVFSAVNGASAPVAHLDRPARDAGAGVGDEHGDRAPADRDAVDRRGRCRRRRSSARCG